MVYEPSVSIRNSVGDVAMLLIDNPLRLTVSAIKITSTAVILSVLDRVRLNTHRKPAFESAAKQDVLLIVSSTYTQLQLRTFVVNAPTLKVLVAMSVVYNVQNLTLTICKLNE